MSIYKACDIRGEYGRELSTHHAARLGEAVAHLTGAEQVLVGGDGRESTPVLKAALVESLRNAGCRVVDVGMVPTPLFYFARRRLGIDVGVMVTASHNPARDNGFKVTLGPLPVTVTEMQALAEFMEGGQSAPVRQRGEYARVDLLGDYLAFLAEHTPDLRGLKVVVDCANGMAGPLARGVWERTGAQVTYLLEAVDGRFPEHAPNPAEEKNLALLKRAVGAQGAGLGVAYDGDADRVSFVDEQGSSLGNDQAIVLFARYALRAGAETIVYDQKCSRIVPDTVRRMGGTPVMALSGHTFIKRAFLDRNAAYAGELSGHHFLRSLGGDDGLAASLVFARLLRESTKTLSQLAAEIPCYPITPDIRLPMAAEDAARLMDELEERLRGSAGVTRSDGVRLEFARGWALVRPSVTEPVVTVRMEGVDGAALTGIAETLERAHPLLAGQLANAARKASRLTNQD